MHSLAGQRATSQKASRSFSQHESARRSKGGTFEAKVAAMQRDSTTFCDEPPESLEYSAFYSYFDVKAKSADIVDLLKSNKFMAELHASLVPVVVTEQEFWRRYFFRWASMLAYLPLYQILLCSSPSISHFVSTGLLVLIRESSSGEFCMHYWDLPRLLCTKIEQEECTCLESIFTPYATGPRRCALIG
jgi:hypothetical protein